MKPILLKNLLLLESISYKAPSAPNYLLYDFYVLSYIRTLNINPHAKGFIGRFNQPETLKDDIDHADSVLLPHLKKHILDVLFFCICAEIRHFMPFTYDKDKKEEVISKHPVLADYMDSYRKISRGKHSTPTNVYNSVPRPTPPGQTRKSEYVRSWRAAKHAISDGYSIEHFVKAAYDAFDDINNWESEYGGIAWQNICKAWIKLASAKNHNEVAVAVDHIYDLHHNTGFVLNKIPEYKGSWVKIALDHKAKVTDIRQLFPHCSSDMKKLAAQAIRAAGHSYSQPKVGNEITDNTGGKWEGDWDGKIWKFGKWYNGTWPGGTWTGGIWLDGTWTNGLWKDGDWYRGIWKNGIWNKGLWRNGSHWAGSWYGGTWEDGHWGGGTWYDGTWKNGVWTNGDWYGGTWEGGKWYGGRVGYNGDMHYSDVSPAEFYKKMEAKEQGDKLDPNAPGVVTWPDGSKTQGKWANKSVADAENDEPVPDEPDDDKI
jgi:hypothetical protein